ncbi:MAG: hypothetical protein LBR12_00560, partial [Opitutaceae bacterium]|nr:hypothetical protein [Opitutaceae bacterium]
MKTGKILGIGALAVGCAAFIQAASTMETLQVNTQAPSPNSTISTDTVITGHTSATTGNLDIKYPGKANDASWLSEGYKTNSYVGAEIGRAS